MLQIAQAIAVIALVITAFIAVPAAIARRIEANRRRAAHEAVEAYREHPTDFFDGPMRRVPLLAEPTVPVPVAVVPAPRVEDPILAALRRREELVRGNLDRIWVEFVEGLGWKGAQAARALLVGSGELPIAALAA